MPTLPNWNLSHQSRARMTELLQSAAALGLDPDAVASGGLAAFQALIALKRAHDAGEGAARDALIVRTQEALRGLDPGVHQDLLQQVQARILALQGRGGDTELAHVTPGEIVLPAALQTPAVMGALREAAAAADIPLDQLRVGSGVNNINPQTGAAEFAEEPIPEIHINAIRPSEENVNLLARMIYGEAANQSAVEGLYNHLGWAAINRVGAPSFPDTLGGVITKPGEFKSVGSARWAEFDKPETLDPLSTTARQKALDAARGILYGDIPDPTDGAQFFFHGDPDPWFQKRIDSGRLVPIDRNFGNLTLLRDVEPPKRR